MRSPRWGFSSLVAWKLFKQLPRKEQAKILVLLIRKVIPMDKVLKFLDGKKTYCIAGAIVVCGILSAYGVEIPEYVWAALGALGLGWLRSGVKKAEP